MSVVEAIERDGVWCGPGPFDAPEIVRLRDCTESLADEEDEAVRRRDGQAFAVRDLLRRSPSLREVLLAAPLMDLVRAVLGPGAVPVRGILFDKREGANWRVGWHQDRAVAVAERVEAEGFGPWSRKAGVWHVNPPVGLLQRMLTARLHLDETGEDNGALRVVPGSHAHGVLDSDRVEELLAGGERCCALPAGGLLLMRPLLLHASSRSTREGARRRVIHVEFADGPPPGGLAWRNL